METIDTTQFVEYLDKHLLTDTISEEGNKGAVILQELHGTSQDDPYAKNVTMPAELMPVLLKCVVENPHDIDFEIIAPLTSIALAIASATMRYMEIYHNTKNMNVGEIK